jgi:hypothetical protein
MTNCNDNAQKKKRQNMDMDYTSFDAPVERERESKMRLKREDGPSKLAIFWLIYVIVIVLLASGGLIANRIAAKSVATVTCPEGQERCTFVAPGAATHKDVKAGSKVFTKRGRQADAASAAMFAGAGIMVAVVVFIILRLQVP